jgi:hypothetical protein
MTSVSPNRSGQVSSVADSPGQSPPTGPLSRSSTFQHRSATRTGSELRRSVSLLSRPRGDVLPVSPAPLDAAPPHLVSPAPLDAAPPHMVLAVLGRNRSPADAKALIGTAGSFSGRVEMKQGQLTSPQPVIDALLKHARNELAGITLDGPASLTLTLDPRARRACDLMVARCKIEKVDVLVNDQSPLLAGGTEPIKGNVLIPLLQQVIMNGRAAFGEHARITIDLGNMDLHDFLSGLLLQGQSIHLHDYLARLNPSVTSDHDALAGAIGQKITDDPDLRAKLAAASLLQIATKKEIVLGGLMGSLTVSSGLGSAWELAAAPAVKAVAKKLLEHAGLPSPTQVALSYAGIDSIPPMIIEALDTMCVLSILKTMKGEKDWTFKGLIPKALKAGAISSALSVPNNVMQYLSTGSKAADLAINAVTTEAAIFGAASGVPMEIEEDNDNLRAALVQGHNDGLLAPLPQGADPRQHVAEMTQRALDVDPGTSLAQKSMAVAATVGMVPLLLSDKALNLVPESVLRIVRSTVFNPIEAIALGALVLGARAKLPGVFTSDHDKHADLTRLILQRAADGPGGGERPIQAQELDRIFNPPQELLRRVGTALSTGINTMVGVPAKGVQLLATTLGLANDSPSLEQRLPYEQMRDRSPGEAV